ncbi:uncharacterized protein BDW70DRAFT_137210 [Aspergillus foveolatus]|uniref:uncharacterized protein n=1 Tax=Aspergillus foveolatus TaxID=210207 RepID=UPI003CCD5DEA
MLQGDSKRLRFSTRHSAARLEIILLTWDLSNPADIIPRIVSASASRSRTLSCLYDNDTIPRNGRAHCYGQRLGSGDCRLMAREHILLLMPKQSAEVALPFRSIGLRSGRGISRYISTLSIRNPCHRAAVSKPTGCARGTSTSTSTSQTRRGD